jgi:HSP20 family molecular chaperone IbpA
MIRLAVTTVELKISCRLARDSEPLTLYFIASNPTGFVLKVDQYYEAISGNEGKAIFRSVAGVAAPGPLNGELITKPYETSQKFERQRAEKQLTKQSETNIKELTSVRTLGEKRIADEKDKTERSVARMESQNQNGLEREQKQFESRRQNMANTYQTQFNTSSDAYRRNLNQQREHYNSAFTKNQANNEESLGLQKQMYDKQLLELKGGLARKVERYAERENDPFYKVEDRDTQVHETLDSYIVRAFVPDYEKENVKIHVSGNKATVTGNRAFHDKVEGDDGRKVTTNSFQTFHEEIPFEHPVAAEAVYQQREGDYLTVTIPKLGSNFNGTIPRFSRKV